MDRQTVVEQLRRCWVAGVPIVSIETQDAQATMRAIVGAVNGSGRAVCQWDILRGVTALNQAASSNLQAICGGRDADTLNSPSEVLLAVYSAPEKTVLIMSNAHMYFRGDNAASVIQGISNIREEYKSKGNTLILLSPGTTIPAEIAQDVMVIDDPLPGEAQLKAIAERITEEAGVDEVGDIIRITDTMVGLSAFAAEQTLATCIERDEAGKISIAMPELRRKKRKAVEQTKGLKYLDDAEALKFEQLKDLDNLRDDILGMAPQFNLVLFMDEIEKSFGGASTDTSGVSQDMHGQILTWMESSRMIDGYILIGHPGTGKSAIAKATAREVGIDCIEFDLGGMKESLVGQSGQNIRAALRVIDAISNKKVLVIATCNSIGALSPELKRRFTLGTFFCDLPSKAGRDAMWDMYAEAYGVLNVRTFDDAGWTGAEIANCCRRASMRKCSLDVAAGYIVPVCRASAETVEALRTQASGKFASASQYGTYQKPVSGSESGKRQFSL